MQRLKPDPVPPIRPVPEYAADDRLRAVYEDTKRALGAPWMGVVTMAFAAYPRFYDALWSGLRPIVTTAEFQAACARLRAVAEDEVAALPVGDLRPDLARRGYADAEIDRIREVVDVFSAGNQPYLLIATIARLTLEGGAPSGGAGTPTEPPRMAAAMPPLMERHHGGGELSALYDDVQATLGLPFVNTDYRALARWPSAFGAMWSGLRPMIGSAAHDAAVLAIHEEAARLAAAAPNPERLNEDALRAAMEDGPVEDTVRLFQWLLPGLVANVAVFRRQLSGL